MRPAPVQKGPALWLVKMWMALADWEMQAWLTTPLSKLGWLCRGEAGETMCW